MRLKRVMLMLLLCMIAGASQATIIALRDTVDRLHGSFSFVGNESGRFVPVDFQPLMPRPQRLSFLGGGRTPGLLVGFNTSEAGQPDSPGKIIFDPLRSFQEFNNISGTYNNNGALPGTVGTDVHFVFWDWQDTGGSAGTFSGNFCFATSRICSAVLPEPQTSVLMMAALLVSVFAVRRKRV